jgi:uncharacterized protein YdaU (DUF1376 family)
MENFSENLAIQQGEKLTLAKEIEMPYLKLFIGDEMANIGLYVMDVEDYGAFCLLRNHIWKKSFLSSDKKDLAKKLRISTKKFEKIWEKILPLFLEKDGKLIIPELESQRAKYIEFIEKSREGGKKSAENRGKVGSASVEGGLKVASSNLNFKIHNSKSKSQSAEITLSKPNASASHGAGDDASASESEQPTFDDFINYVSALKAAGKPIDDTSAYAARMFRDPIAKFSVGKWLATGSVDYKKPLTAGEALLEQFRREKEETEN